MPLASDAVLQQLEIEPLAYEDVLCMHVMVSKIYRITSRFQSKTKFWRQELYKAAHGRAGPSSAVVMATAMGVATATATAMATAMAMALAMAMAMAMGMGWP